LRIAARKHDVTGIRVYDQSEAVMPNLGMVEMLDRETGERRLVHTGSKAVRRNHFKAYQKNVSEFHESFSKCGAGTIDCSLQESYVKKLLGYFKNRA
jgi:hypothetical protein